jgi:hypothetical protein
MITIHIEKDKDKEHDHESLLYNDEVYQLISKLKNKKEDLYKKEKDTSPFYFIFLLFVFILILLIFYIKKYVYYS